MKYESYHTEISQKILSRLKDRGKYGMNTVNKSIVFKSLSEEYKKKLQSDFDLMQFSLTVNYLLLKLQGEGKIKIQDEPTETEVITEEENIMEALDTIEPEIIPAISTPTETVEPPVIPEEKEIPVMVNDVKNPSRKPEEYSKTFKIFSCLFEAVLIIAISAIILFLLTVYFIE